MIQFFIKMANGLVGKIIFGALFLGMLFVLGYSGLTNQNYFASDAIRVGKQRLSIRQLDFFFQEENKRLSSMTNTYVSPKQAIEVGLLDKLIQQKTNEMILSEVKSNLGLIASNAAVRQYIERNPAFHDVSGHYDRRLLVAYMRQMGMGEREFAHNLQEQLSTNHLTDTLKGMAYAPTDLVEVMYRYQNETRDVDSLFVETKKIKIDQQPTQKNLQDYYELYASDLFTTPEYRSFKYVDVTPEVLAASIQVSDEELQPLLETAREQYTVPEKRRISQMLFADEETARDVLKKTTAANFLKIAEDTLNQKPDITDFGFVAYNGLVEELAEAAFNAPVGKVIGPVESPTGWHLLLVTGIQEGKVPSEKELISIVKKQLQNEKGYAILETTMRQLDSLLGEGKTLEEAAKELSLPVKEMAAADISGVRKNGKVIPETVANRDMLKDLFTLKVGEATMLYDNGNGFIVAELTEVIPAGVKPFEEIKKDLTELWIADRQKEQLQSVVDNLLNRIEKGADIRTVSVSTGYSLIQLKALKRIDVNNLPLSVVQTIFEQKVGPENVETVSTENGVYITVLNQVNSPVSRNDKDGLKNVQEAVKMLSAEELTENMLAGFATDLGVIINRNAIDKAFAVYTEN